MGRRNRCGVDAFCTEVLEHLRIILESAEARCVAALDVRLKTLEQILR
jgi:hypothetical protein